jgi:hypothetical protein
MSLLAAKHLPETLAEPGIGGWVCQMRKISKQISNTMNDNL